MYYYYYSLVHVTSPRYWKCAVITEHPHTAFFICSSIFMSEAPAKMTLLSPSWVLAGVFSSITLIFEL